MGVMTIVTTHIAVVQRVTIGGMIVVVIVAAVAIIIMMVTSAAFLIGIVLAVIPMAVIVGVHMRCGTRGVGGRAQY